MKAIRLVIPRTIEEKRRGLLPFKQAPQGWAMLFVDTKDIHMIGMRFPIDVVFLDSSWRVIDIRRAVPGERHITTPNAQHILEMAPGEAADLRIGHKLHL